VGWRDVTFSPPSFPVAALLTCPIRNQALDHGHPLQSIKALAEMDAVAAKEEVEWDSTDDRRGRHRLGEADVFLALQEYE
jgi:hypothetical protein